MRITLLLLSFFIFSPASAQACITPFLLPPQDIKILLEKDAAERAALEVERLNEFQRDLEYYNTLKVTCMGWDATNKEMKSIGQSKSCLKKNGLNK
jgi:hypothetical protein